MIIKDSHITVYVKDLDRSISFYQSFGLTLKNRWQNEYAMLTVNGITIGLHPSNNETLKDNSGNVSIGFATDNMEEVKSELQKLNINFTERNEGGGQFLHFTDLNGTALYFIKSDW